MRLLRTKKFTVLLAVVLAAGATASVAIPAVISTRIPTDSNSVHLQVVQRTANGFDSGWHIHPGLAIVQVQGGSVAITQGSCTPKTLGPGDTYLEVPHQPVRAVATGFFAWTTTFVVATGAPLQVPWSSYGGGVPDPCP